MKEWHAKMYINKDKSYGKYTKPLPYIFTVEPPKTDSPYYGNLHNADKSPRSQIIPYTIVYVLRKPPY